MLIKHWLIVIIACVLGACAATPEDGDADAADGASRSNDCIHQPSIRGYSVLDEQNLIVEASGRRKYHVVLRRRAYGLRNSFGIEFDSTTSRVCAGFDGIRYRDSMDRSVETTRISTIRQLTPEEEEHLLIRFGKKEPEIKHVPAPNDVEGADVEELDEAASE